MAFPIFGKADGNVGGVGMLDEVCVFLIPFQNRLEDEERPEGKTVEIHHERLVRTGWTEDVPDRFLRDNALRLFEQGEGDRFDGIDC